MAKKSLIQKLKETDPKIYAAIVGLLFTGSVSTTLVSNNSNPSSSNPSPSPSTPTVEQVQEKFINAPLSVKLAVSSAISPTLNQRDNYTMPHRTCNSSSNAMYLNFYRSFIGKPQVTDDVYLFSVLKRGDTIYHEVQTRTLIAYGLDTVWNDDENLDRVKSILRKGYPVVVNILHRGSVNQGTLRGGHIIVLRSYDGDKFAVSDPYGILESNYNDYSKFTYYMSEAIFKARWQGGYRTISNKQAELFEIEKQ